MGKYKCSICGYVYDESTGILEMGITPGTKWEDIPDSFICPICRAPKSVFKPFEETSAPLASPPADGNGGHVDLKELSAGEISAICSSLAKGCEKQRLDEEMEAFYKIAGYFKAKAMPEEGKTLEDAAKMLDGDMANRFSAANGAANVDQDRGALRSLVWSEKVSAMMKALLERFAKEGEAMLANTKIWVCDICGLIYIGDAPPEICPVCKVPNFKILEMERR